MRGVSGNSFHLISNMGEDVAVDSKQCRLPTLILHAGCQLLDDARSTANVGGIVEDTVAE